MSRNCFCAELSVSQLCHFWRSLCLRWEWYGVTPSPWKLSVIFLYFTVLPNLKIIARIFLDSSSNATSSENWAQKITATGFFFFSQVFIDGIRRQKAFKKQLCNLQRFKALLSSPKITEDICKLCSVELFTWVALHLISHQNPDTPE